MMDSKAYDKKLIRFLKALNMFGSSRSRYVELEKQLERDLKFMNKKYEEAGRWETGKIHAQKELFKRIFKTSV